MSDYGETDDEAQARMEARGEDLGANGYVVVPRRDWDRFLAQADFLAIRSPQEGTYAKSQYNLARAAVVEAVGPTPSV